MATRVKMRTKWSTRTPHGQPRQPHGPQALGLSDGGPTVARFALPRQPVAVPRAELPYPWNTAGGGEQLRGRGAPLCFFTESGQNLRTSVSHPTPYFGGKSLIVVIPDERSHGFN